MKPEGDDITKVCVCMCVCACVVCACVCVCVCVCACACEMHIAFLFTQQLHILINGPSDTPYEGGFFHFILRFPPDYPYHPPRVRLMTTGGGRVRFNPNLYENGTVCLSTLG